MNRLSSSAGPSKTKMISRRMFILSVAKVLVFTGIVGRLVSLQINESKKYRTLSDKNRFREWKLAPQRGVIRDFFNREIASNEKVYQLHITPENALNLESLFFRLKNILDLSDKKIALLKKKISKQKPWEPIIVSENLSWSEFSKINLFLHELQGVEPIVSVARVYPNPSTSHIVGYVSQVSAKDLKRKEYLREMSVTGIAVGKTGLENMLDKNIIGKVGFQRYEVNAYGKRIRQIHLDKGQTGENYKTTNNVFLVGDAAGFAESLLGEGIYNAVVSGKYAAKAIINCKLNQNNAYQEYNKFLSSFTDELKLYKKGAKILYGFPRISYWMMKFGLGTKFMNGYSTGKTLTEIMGKSNAYLS